jgi:hypothetical protein
MNRILIYNYETLLVTHEFEPSHEATLYCGGVMQNASFDEEPWHWFTILNDTVGVYLR